MDIDNIEAEPQLTDLLAALLARWLLIGAESPRKMAEDVVALFREMGWKGGDK